MPILSISFIRSETKISRKDGILIIGDLETASD